MAGLLLLSFLWSLSSLRADLFPNLTENLVPYMEKQVASFALLALLAGLIAFVRRAEWPRGREVWNWLVVGFGLFVVPAGLVYLSNESISGQTRVALFALAPVFAVVFEPYLGAGTRTESRNGLAAALVAVIGTLCVFPLALPGTMEGGMAFFGVILAAGCVAAANCRAVKLSAELRGRPVLPVAAIAGATAGVGLAAVSAMTERAVWNWSALGPELAWSAGVELPGLLLLFWLMGRMSAARMATRYVLAPWIAIVVGLMLMRPAVGVRIWLGMALVAIGAGWLLFSADDGTAGDGASLKLGRE
jgi:drug/metabolite transporter (DMT)-like permease